MTRWEYRMEMPTADFNNLGAEGWELCAVLHNGLAVFKRLLRAPDHKTRVSRFTPVELQSRAIEAARQRARWEGRYPYRECTECFAQIHVGGIPMCEDCQRWHREQEGSDEFDGWIGGTKVREVLD